MKTLPYHHLFALGLLVLFHGAALSQSGTSEKSVGQIAREANEAKKAKEVHAKVVVTDELMKEKSGTLPSIPSDGADNSDAILSAIQQYRSKHTAQETESLVHDWFDQNDKEMADAIDENRRIEYGPSDPTYRTEGEYRMAMQNQRYDYQKKKENGLLMARIQNMFTRIRNGLQKQGYKYAWFKIRCGNGNCTY